MLWENRQSNYDKYPKIKIKEIDELSSEAYEGYADIVNVLNLIEGEEAIVTSPENLFAPSKRPESTRRRSIPAMSPISADCLESSVQKT